MYGHSVDDPGRGLVLGLAGVRPLLHATLARGAHANAQSEMAAPRAEPHLQRVDLCAVDSGRDVKRRDTYQHWLGAFCVGFIGRRGNGDSVDPRLAARVSGWVAICSIEPSVMSGVRIEVPGRLSCRDALRAMQQRPDAVAVHQSEGGTGATAAAAQRRAAGASIGGASDVSAAAATERGATAATTSVWIMTMKLDQCSGQTYVW